VRFCPSAPGSACTPFPLSYIRRCSAVAHVGCEGQNCTLEKLRAKNHCPFASKKMTHLLQSSSRQPQEYSTSHAIFLGQHTHACFFTVAFSDPTAGNLVPGPCRAANSVCLCLNAHGMVPSQPCHHQSIVAHHDPNAGKSIHRYARVSLRDSNDPEPRIETRLESGAACYFICFWAGNQRFLGLFQHAMGRHE
jgi:hypothetical protein